MNIQEEILSSFFNMLSELEGFPGSILKRLVELWKEGNLASKSHIREAISRETQDGSED